MKITAHFDSREFDCHDGTPYPPDWIESRLKPLCHALEALRGYYDRPIVVLSGYRTPYWNKKVGGARQSQHLEGKASDIHVVGISPRYIQATIERLIGEGKMLPGGLGRYRTFTHYDTRGRNARWEG